MELDILDYYARSTVVMIIAIEAQSVWTSTDLSRVSFYSILVKFFQGFEKLLSLKERGFIPAHGMLQ